MASVPTCSDCSHRNIKLVVFDVDGTLVEHDHGLVVWQVLNHRFGCSASVNAERYRAFVAGELTYAQWVDMDIEGWRSAGADRSQIEDAIRAELRLAPFAKHVVHQLRQRGYELAVVSGTLDVVLSQLFPDHPFSHVFTNRISFNASGTIEAWQATPYDMDGKAHAVQMIARLLDIPPEDVAFVGDHLNDRSALQWVGCPVAYDPKHDEIRALARHVLPRGRLDLLLDLLPPIAER